MSGIISESREPAKETLIRRWHLKRLLAIALLTALAWAGFANGSALRADGPGNGARDIAHGDELKKAKETTKDRIHGEEPTAMGHVMDSTRLEFFEKLGLEFELPKILGFQITKFMVMEVVAAGLILLIFIPLARKLRTGAPAQGWKDNMFEVLLAFIRDEVAKPAIGEHDADRFVPFLWTLFLFILFNNLLGLLPFGASPTASIYVTGALALCVFFAIHGSAIAKMGWGHYLSSYWLPMDVPYLGVFLQVLIFLLEILGVVVRNAVLAVRLFANMFAGHMVTATILLFILAATNSYLLWSAITIGSVLGIVALSLLELFVAFLQAYIFVFLAALFMGMAMHPQH